MAPALSARTVFAYGLFTLPLSIAGLPLVIHLPPFYATARAIDLTTLGAVLMVARIIDVITDPIVGSLSDRWPTRFGRRRPWVAAGTPLMMLGTWQLFVPPPAVGPLYLFTWISVLYLGWTMVAIPYGAWGAELSTDYHERSRITGVREACTVVGLLMASILPVTLGGDLSAGLRLLASVTVVLLPLCAVALVTGVPEPNVPWSANPTLDPQMLRSVMRNGPFRRLLLATVLGGIGGSINGSLMILFYTHAMRLPAVATLFPLLYFATGMLAIPAWLAISRRIGKHRTLVTAACWGCAWFALTPLLPPESALPAAILTMMSGVAMAVPQVMGPSMAADVIELDTLRTGQVRAAIYVALWSVGHKAALALGVGIALPILDWWGFTAAGPNGPRELTALTVMYCLAPVLCWVASVAPLWHFPITPERQVRLRAAAGRRAARRHHRAVALPNRS